MTTYLIGPSSTIDPGRPGLSYTVLPAASWPLFLAMHFSYLGAQTARRNEAVNHRSQDGSQADPKADQKAAGTLTMTTFDKREEAFEKKFALDEEQKFKAEARRNKLLGLWVAEKLGMSGEAANAYAKEVIAAEFEEAGDADVVRKVMGDLLAKGIAVVEQEILARMDELMAVATAQVKAGV